jgi:hypothetical protein
MSPIMSGILASDHNTCESGWVSQMLNPTSGLRSAAHQQVNGQLHIE